MDTSVQNVGEMQVYDRYMEVKIGGRKKRFYYIWLRDNCRCEKCYSTFFNQIVNHIFNVPLNVKPNNCKVTIEKLIIAWEDGHNSEYSFKWLDSFEFEYKPKIDTCLWDQNIVEHLKDMVVPVDVYLKNLNGVKTLAGSILKYGFGMVSGVELSVNATRGVVEHLAPVQKTFFGEMWHVRPNSDCNDTSSTNLGLLPHNDNTYFTNPAGLQIFHLLHHNGEGGNTVLVDGFCVANNIKKKTPEAFETLCKVAVEARFIDKSHHFICTEPTLKLHPVTKELYQVRFNIYDRSPLTSVKDEELFKFYEALILFGKEVNDSRNQYLFKLQPGTVVFIDNWRVLHGRTEYTGNRDITGCYISRDDFISATKRLYPELQ